MRTGNLLRNDITLKKLHSDLTKYDSYCCIKDLKQTERFTIKLFFSSIFITFLYTRRNSFDGMSFKGVLNVAYFILFVMVFFTYIYFFSFVSLGHINHSFLIILFDMYALSETTLFCVAYSSFFFTDV